MTLDIESAVMISPVVISTLLLLCYLTTCNFPFQSVWQRQHSQLSNILMYMFPGHADNDCKAKHACIIIWSTNSSSIAQLQISVIDMFIDVYRENLSSQYTSCGHQLLLQLCFSSLVWVKENICLSNLFRFVSYASSLNLSTKRLPELLIDNNLSMLFHMQLTCCVCL